MNPILDAQIWNSIRKLASGGAILLERSNRASHLRHRSGSGAKAALERHTEVALLDYKIVSIPVNHSEHFEESSRSASFSHRLRKSFSKQILGLRRFRILLGIFK